MKKPLFSGACVALVTPFDDNGIDFEKLEELIEYQIKNNIDAILVCGTTGEAAAMTDEEKKAVLKFAAEKIAGRVKILAGTGSNNKLKSVGMSQYAQSLGYDGLLLVTPYYNKTTQKGLCLHYAEIAKSVSIPIILYNVPSRTNVSISIDTLLYLDKNFTNIVGIKEASGDLSYAARIAAETDIVLYSGNDDHTLSYLALGGQGVISVAANIFPSEMHSMCKLFSEGDLSGARALCFDMLEVMRAMFYEVNPIPVKTALNLLGFNVGALRLPLCEMGDENKKRLEKALNNFKK